MSAQPVVYFIDDSATMREVIKIAFRRENIEIVTCHDADSALEQIETGKPDVVISDVIMPGRDGYEVCQYIKQHPRLSQTPVILMSGVVNKTVAEKAFAVRADELIRKPFQPQDLITRVRHLIAPRKEAPVAAAAGGVSAPAVPPPPATPATAGATLSSIFSGPMPQRPVAPRPLGPIPVPRPQMPRTVPPAAIAPPVAPPPRVAPPAPAAAASTTAIPSAPVTSRVPPPPGAHSGSELALKVEAARLQSVIKKLQAELAAEREYSRALEEHVKTLQDAD